MTTIDQAWERLAPWVAPMPITSITKTFYDEIGSIGVMMDVGDNTSFGVSVIDAGDGKMLVRCTLKKEQHSGRDLLLIDKIESSITTCINTTKE